MHMSDSLVSAAVGTTMAAVSAGAIGYSIKKIKDTDLNNSKIPMMGVMGAFVFAAQMINFTIPGTGSSGHIGGGILLAGLLGAYPAFLTITSVLIIQALFFADGGLLALGCNIFNVGFLPCIIAYPLIYKQIIKNKVTAKRLSFASIIAVILGLQLGAFAVVLETTVSGVTELPFGTFLLLMQPIHLAIGIIEGVVTGAVLCFVYKTRKEIILGAINDGYVKKSYKKTLIVFAVAALVIGGGLSYFASNNPDGLEWAIGNIIGDKEIGLTSDTQQKSTELQDKIAILPDYSLNTEVKMDVLDTGIPGVIGGIVTLIITIAVGMIIMRFKRNKEHSVVNNKEKR